MSKPDFTDFIDEAARLLIDDDVIHASNALLRAVTERASSNGTIAAAMVMDSVALAVSLASTPEELGAMTLLIQDATAETITRRLLMISANAKTAAGATAAHVTVH